MLSGSSSPGPGLGAVSGRGVREGDARATAAVAAVAAAALSAAGWRELEGNRRAQRADKAGATKRDQEGGPVEPDPGATRLGFPDSG